MKEGKIPGMGIAGILLIAIYVFLKYLLPLFTVPIPSSIIYMYLSIVLIGILIYFSVEDEDWKKFVSPIVEVFEVETPSKKLTRYIILAMIPLLVGYSVYSYVGPSGPSAQLRSAHPAPPTEYIGLENPVSPTLENIEVGKELFKANCAPCHGENADGKGKEAQAWFPAPADFTDTGTIASLQESYLFWRINEGGIGMPPEGLPSDSAMPAWKDVLTEEEIWKIIMAEYDIAGVQPRTWE